MFRDGGMRRRGGGRSSHDRRIYVSNVPFDYKWQDVRDLFNKEGEAQTCTLV